MNGQPLKSVTHTDDRTRRLSAQRPSYLRIVEAESTDARIVVSNDRLRRLLNVSVAILGILVTLPLWVIIAIVIKLTSRGPIIHAQTRVGLDSRSTGSGQNDPRRRHDIGGRPFTMYKFRTMQVTAEKQTGAVWATANDPRVTAAGRILRQYRLDELPQLINVLKGDMNIVGPRPERPTIFASLSETVPNYRLRQRARPGITGLAQIRQQYDSCVDDVKRKVEFDLEYIREPSFWRDLKIMLETIPVILLRRGGW
jgi:lipopolysaccharide/colanic/teichoic acid biosynthesis glycosyltransferase